MNSYSFSSQAEKNSRLGKLVSDSSMPPYRSLKANSEEASIIKVNSLLIASLVFIQSYNLLLTVTASTQPQHRYLVLEYSWPSPGGHWMRGTAGPGVFLLGASGRTGRFFTQLLFHNPHSTTIRQIHLVWQWTKKQKQNRRILTISTDWTSCISQPKTPVKRQTYTKIQWNTLQVSLLYSFHLRKSEV